MINFRIPDNAKRIEHHFIILEPTPEQIKIERLKKEKENLEARLARLERRLDGLL